MRLLLLFCSFCLVTQASNGQTQDLKLVEFDSPETYGCDYADSIAVSVVLFNGGTTVRTGIEVSYQWNGVIISTEMVPGSISPNGYLQYTFKQKLFVSIVGLYLLDAWIGNNPGDNNLNDTIHEHPVKVGSIVSSFPFVEDFNSGLPTSWDNDLFDVGNDWSIDTMGSISSWQSFSGSGGFALLRHNNHFIGSTNLLSPCLDISGLARPTLTFDLFNPEAIFTLSMNMEVFFNGSWANLGGPIAYQDTSWVHYLYDLSPFSGDIIKIRWRGEKYQLYNFADIGIDNVKVIDRPAINIDLIGSNLLGSDCGLSSSEVIEVDIRHVGFDTLYPGDVVYLNYQVDGGIVVGENMVVSDTVPPMGTVTYTFSGPANLSGIGNHEIRIWSDHALDTDHTNDTLAYNVFNRVYIQQFPYVEGFEQSTGSWYAVGERSTWKHGTPNGNVIQGAASGTKAWGTGHLNGGYADQERSYLVSPCFDFSNLAYPQIAFNIWFDCLLNGAAVRLECTQDQEEWVTIGEMGDDVNWYNLAYGWSGSGSSGSSGWMPVKHDLPSLAGVPKVMFRIVFHNATVNSNQYDGVAVDDIAIMDAPGGGLPSTISDCGYVLLDAGPNGVKYLWSNGDTSRTTLVVSGYGQSVHKQYTVYIENALGFYSTDTVFVNLAPGPYVNLGQDTMVCLSDTLVLESGATTGANVLWDNNDSARSRIITTSGTYWVQVTAAGCTKSDTIAVEFGTSPVSDFEFHQEIFGSGWVMVFEDRSQFAGSYHWDFGDGSASRLASPEHFYHDTGTYMVTLVITNNCGADTITKLITVRPLGLEGLDLPGIRIYPNPTSGYFNVEFAWPDRSMATLELWNSYGVKVHSDVIALDPGKNRIQYKHSNLPAGVYLFRLIIQGKHWDTAIIKY